MPLPPNTETKLPQLLADYATTRREDLGLPSATALPFVVAPYIGDQEFPRAVFVTSAVSSTHPKRLNLTVSVEIQSDAKTQEIADENTWAAGLRYILADAAAFQTWLNAQETATRTGFRIRKYRLSDEPAVMAIDEKTQTRARRTDVIVHVRTDEAAPAAAS